MSSFLIGYVLKTSQDRQSSSFLLHHQYVHHKEAINKNKIVFKLAGMGGQGPSE